MTKGELRTAVSMLCHILAEKVPDLDIEDIIPDPKFPYNYWQLEVKDELWDIIHTRAQNARTRNTDPNQLDIEDPDLEWDQSRRDPRDG